jgi:hypothetical protein
VLKHGDTRARRRAPEYRYWQDMKRRCLNPNAHNYGHYGARGISVCPEWVNDYEAFLAHVGRRPSPEHSLDRIDNDRGYEPGNVRWGTKAEQANNRRPRPTRASPPTKWALAKRRRQLVAERSRESVGAPPRNTAG